MAYEAQTYDKTRNTNAAGGGALGGAGAGALAGASIGAAAGVGVASIPLALIGGAIGAVIGAAGGAGAGSWTDDAAQKQEIKTSEKNVASAIKADKEFAFDKQAMDRAAMKPTAPGGLPSGQTYMPSGGGNTGYDAWKSQLRGY